MQGAKFLETVKVYGKPVMVSMLVLGFASGLPLYMVFQKISFWLRDAGLERSTIGFFYWVTLSYTLKFLWAPVVDRVRIPFLTEKIGRRRSWIVTAIGGTVIALLLISRTDPTQSLWPVAIGALLLAYSGATLDVAIDAWRIESAPNKMQANMAAAYSLGYRVAYMTSGLGLAIAGWSSWGVSFMVMAGAMALSAALVFLMKEPTPAKDALDEKTIPFVQRMTGYIIQPFSQILGRLGLWFIPVLLFVAIYRLSDFTMGVMASPLYSDIGYSKAVVGGIQSGPGLIALIAGLFIGGMAVYRLGLMRALMVGIVITLLTNGAYAWLAHQFDANDTMLLIGAICADNLAGGFVTTAFIAYLSSLVDPKNAATQYALLSSFYAFFNKLMAGFSGVIADALGYVSFFLLTAGWTLPAGLLLLFLMARAPDAAIGKHQFKERLQD